MSAGRGKNIAGGAARLVWLLTATALAVGAAVLIQFDNALQTVRAAREAVATADGVCNGLLDAFDDDLFRLDTQVQGLLENRDPAPGPATFREFRTRVRAESRALASRPVLVAPIITAAQQLERDVDGFEALRARAGLWQNRHRDILARFHDDRAKTSDAIAALRSAAESAEGQERLRHLVPTDAKAGPPIPDRTRELNAIKTELAELALACANLAAERDPDALADYKDNRFAPALARVSGLLARAGAEAPKDDPLRPGMLGAFEAALFGEGATFDTERQSITPGNGGLFASTRALSLSLRQCEDLRHEADSANRGLRDARDAVSQKATAEAAAVAAKVRADLVRARSRTFAGGLVGALAFLALALAIAHRLRRIVRHIERSNESLERASELAQSASRAKTEFLANMSHEIRTPMTAILGYADLLADPVQTAAQRAEGAQTIRKNGEHLLSILNDILDLSKIEAGRMTVQPQDCSPVQIVEDAVSLLRPRAVSKGISLRAEYRFPLPATIRTDPVRLKQILLNLLGNAVKFTETGGVCVAIALVDREGGGEALRFEVADTGIGMNEDQLSRLFQPFTQVEGAANRRYGGTGLGLAIAQRLSNLLGGEISVISRAGDGSTFTLHIDPGPLSRARWIHSVRAAAQPHATPSPAGKLRARILLAEDGEDNQRLIAFHLRRAGATVEIAENGRIAVDKIFSGGAVAPFDLVLMDMQMPELDGYSATRELRQRGHHGPVIALTAHAMPGDRERCLAAGCNEYLTKPVDPAKLVATCAEYLPQRAAA